MDPPPQASFVNGFDLASTKPGVFYKCDADFQQSLAAAYLLSEVIDVCMLSSQAESMPPTRFASKRGWPDSTLNANSKSLKGSQLL
jgi:hypothetical protein